MQGIRRGILVTGFLLLVFGLLCLNYMKADGLVRHREAARVHGLPPPSAAILYGGVLAVILGAGSIGYAIGVRRRTPSQP